ncbi:MAG: VWA domain-containing protein, partial [Pseudomonadota bacterium]
MGFRAVLAILASLILAAAPAVAEENDSILVLDASGSMWGQIEGEAKITIAKRVLGDLLDDLPADRRLGLIAYGHRRKGDCADIEELASVGADRAAIASAVSALNPKGKTPMADSIKLAAQKLKYTENKATVILVSDGIETCAPDPCGVAAALEQAGVDFTAHVIGFDVTEENDSAQLRCIAENTGGKYVSASNADELGEALEETVAAAPEAVTVTKVRLRATELEGGLVIEEGLQWTVTPSAGGDPVVTQSNAGIIDAEVAPGVYDIAVERPSDGLKGAQTGVRIEENTWKTVTIALTFPVEASVRAEPAGEAMAGTNINVHWTGPDRRGDYIAIAEKGADKGSYLSYRYVSQGNPAALRLPVEPGDYEIRYMLGRPIRNLASIDFKVTPASATLSAQDEAIAGEEVSVEFTGPPAGSGD